MTVDDNPIAGKLTDATTLILSDDQSELTFTHVASPDKMPDSKTLQTGIWYNDLMEIAFYADNTLSVIMSGESLSGTYQLNGAVISFLVDDAPMAGAFSGEKIYLQGTELTHDATGTSSAPPDDVLDGTLQMTARNVAIDYPKSLFSVDSKEDDRARLIADDGTTIDVEFGFALDLAIMSPADIEAELYSEVQYVIGEALDDAETELSDEVIDNENGYYSVTFTSDNKMGYGYSMLWLNPLTDETYAYSVVLTAPTEIAADYGSALYQIFSSASDIEFS